MTASSTSCFSARPSTGADDARAVLMFGTPAGVVLSPPDPSLLGRSATDLPVREGYVLCGLDPAFIAPISPLPHLSGTVAMIALTERATGAMHPVDHAKALAHRGLEGDRYAAKVGCRATIGPRVLMRFAFPRFSCCTSR